MHGLRTGFALQLQARLISNVNTLTSPTNPKKRPDVNDTLPGQLHQQQQQHSKRRSADKSSPTKAIHC
eukprot:5755028-Amphidinium_carterae.1